jgi:phage/plasmid-like protein (TIGR03299 family)
MAHNLNFNNNNRTWSFASHTEKAWHGLGQVVDQAMTAEEAIKLANLDYEVLKADAQFTTPSGLVVAADGFYSTYRADTNDFLGMVRSRYEIVQNKEAFSFFDAIIDQGEAIFETAGVLGKGERIFVSAKLPDDMLVNGEKVEKYIMLTNSHDGSSSIVAGLTNVRIVCNNTLQAALKGLDNKVSIGHIGGAKDRLREATRVMGIASKYMQEVEAIFNQMADTRMTDDQLHQYITDVFKPEYKVVAESAEQEKEYSTRFKNIVDSTYNFATTHPTQVTSAANGTLWGAYNAISGYFNYVKPFKNQEDKFNSQFFGQGNKQISKAFTKANAILELA